MIPSPIRVVIAEDDALVSEMVQRQLERLGYAIVGEAYDGYTAIAVVTETRPDVVILDIEMLGLNGLEVAEELHASCPTPIVILTAYETQELVNQATAAGAGAYLLKPPQPRDLDRAITIAMARFADIMQLRAMNAELQRLNADLESSNADLEAYAHVVAHDLKDPLSAILGFAEVVQEEHTQLPAEKLTEYLGIIVTKSRKAVSIINGLLLLAEVQHLQHDIKPLQMQQIVKEVLERLAWQIAEREAEITYPEEWPEVRGHAQLAEEVWANYISNALKYGGTRPRIALGYDADVVTHEGNRYYRFWVQDSGPGVPTQLREVLFEPFVRADGGHMRSNGHGLGLNIVRRIVEKFGGAVGVESQPGGGSRFWFTLPTTET